MATDYTFCELREKDVVNTVDGKSLGRIIDVALTCRGQIFGLIAPGKSGFFKNLTATDTLFIPWNNIVKIGEDVILVELSAQPTRILSEDVPPE